MSMDLLFHPFVSGLIFGLILSLMAFGKAYRTSREANKFRRHLTERLELEGDAMHQLKVDKARLTEENQNLRMKINAMNQDENRSSHRDLEVFLRAERNMLVSVPGFAAPWENAKQTALQQLEAEEAGQSMPRRVIAKLFGHSPAPSMNEAADVDPQAIEQQFKATHH